MSRWLVVGANGMLGQDLVAELADPAPREPAPRGSASDGSASDGSALLESASGESASGEFAPGEFALGELAPGDPGPGEPPTTHEVTAVDRDELDIRDPGACLAAVAGHDFVVNVAAWTAVDEAESHEDAAFTVNAVGAANLARACSAAGVRMVQVSTDYVFAGDATSPYAEDAPPAPRSAYGRTKLAGEWAVQALCPQSWIVRTAWLYGAHGPNFVKTMARLAAERETVSVVDDQRGQPTWTVDLAGAIVRLVEAEAQFGTYHGTSSGETTWYGFAQAIFADLGLDPARVLPMRSEDYPLPAPRPAYSVLGHEAWRGAALDPLPSWRKSLTKAVPVVAPR